MPERFGALLRRAASAVRKDGLVNTSTGIGQGRESTYGVEKDAVLLPGQLQEILRTNPYARRAVWLPAKDAMSKGIVLRDPRAPEKGTSEPWLKEMKRLEVVPTLRRLLEWAEGYGAAYIIPITVERGNPSLSTPLDLDRVETVVGLLLATSIECQPDDWTMTHVLGAETMRAERYRVYLPNAFTTYNEGPMPTRWGAALWGSTPVHYSRVIRVLGNPLTRDQQMSHWAEGDSVIQSMFVQLGQVMSTDAAAAVLASEMKQDVVISPYLSGTATGDDATNFFERIQSMHIGKALTSVLMLAKEEEFRSSSVNVAGFKDLSQQIRDAMVVGSGIPEPIFYGKAASGLSSAPGVEVEVYEMLVQDKRTKLSYAAERLSEIIAAQQGAIPARQRLVDVYFPPLRVESPKDVEARRLMVAQRESIYIGAGAIPKTYVAQRFAAPGGWSDSLPAYDPKDYEDPPEVWSGEAALNAAAGAPSSGGSPNSEGKNAPGQIPSLGRPDTPQSNTSGIDVQANNTGE